jgi:hypothetical protein
MLVPKKIRWRASVKYRVATCTFAETNYKSILRTLIALRIPLQNYLRAEPSDM